LGAPCPPVDGGANGLTVGEVVDLLSIAAGLQLDVDGFVADENGPVWACAAFGGEISRGLTALVDMGGNIEGPYTKRWILMDSARVFSIKLLGLLGPGLTGVSVQSMPQRKSMGPTAGSLGRR
jgi:hypothetical protein